MDLTEAEITTAVPGASLTVPRISVSDPDVGGRSTFSRLRRNSSDDERDLCAVCSGVVYPPERLYVFSLVLHRQCLQCAVCTCTLRVAAAYERDGTIYCRAHFPRFLPTSPIMPRMHRCVSSPSMGANGDANYTQNPSSRVDCSHLLDIPTAHHLISGRLKKRCCHAHAYAHVHCSTEREDSDSEDAERGMSLQSLESYSPLPGRLSESMPNLSVSLEERENGGASSALLAMRSMASPLSSPSMRRVSELSLGCSATASETIIDHEVDCAQCFNELDDKEHEEREEHVERSIAELALLLKHERRRTQQLEEQVAMLRTQQASDGEMTLVEARARFKMVDHAVHCLELQLDDKVCLVCMDRHPNVILLPCAHVILCSSCAIHILRSTGMCPLDRKRIKTITRIYTA